MRLAAALAASAALHLAVVAIPGLEHSPRSAASSAVERISVALPGAERRQTAPVPAIHETRSDSPANDRIPEAPNSPAPPDDSGAQESQPADSDDGSWFGIPMPRYYEPKELTERAKPLVDITIDTPAVDAYPDAGKIILLLYINEDGKVDDVEVLSSDIASSNVEATVVEQFQLARFSAGRLNGRPVKSKKKIEVVLKPPMVIKPGAVLSSPAPAKGN